MKQNRYFRTLIKFNSILVLAALLHTACTEDLSSGMTESPITFTIDRNSFEGSGITRGAQVGSISNFGVSASVYDKDAVGGYTSAGCGSYFYNQSATNGTPMNYYWPTANYKMSFYAYYPYGSSDFILQSSANSNGSPTYSYTVPEAIASQIDVMTVQRTDMLCGPQAAVSLSFAHRCTDIRFTAHNQQNDVLTVKSVSVYGVKYSGTLTGSSWTLTGSPNSSSSHPFTLSMTTNVASEATVDLTGASNHFLMLPQTIAAGTDLFVIKTIEDSEERTYTYTLPSITTWEMGKTYTYALTLGNGSLTISSVSVVDWQAIIPITGSFSVNNWTAQ